VIDTHAHLDTAEEGPGPMLARARAAGVDRVLAVGTGIESSRTTLGIAESEKGIFAVLGIHPHQAADADAGRLDELRELLGSPRAVAVGETGLDYFRDYAPADRQRELFENQLALAADLEKPVVVHTRAAESDTASTLTRFEGTVVLHCFSSPELLPIALDRGYYVSFAGNVTYPKAGDLREAAARVPADRILAETDTPYLSPQPVRGRSNEPAHVAFTVAALASARGEDAGELASQIETNAQVAFSLP
jgi:TatD DNase family protein